MRSLLIILLSVFTYWVALGQPSNSDDQVGSRIPDGAVDTDQIADDAITADKMDTGSVSGGIGGTIVDNSITSDDLGANSVDKSEIAPNAVDTSELEADAVTNVKVATGIDAVKLGDGSVTNTEFQQLRDISTASTIQTQLDGKVATTGNESISGVKDFTGVLKGKYLASRQIASGIYPNSSLNIYSSEDFPDGTVVFCFATSITNPSQINTSTTMALLASAQNTGAVAVFEIKTSTDLRFGTEGNSVDLYNDNDDHIRKARGACYLSVEP
jgi:hypothetical protein